MSATDVFCRFVLVAGNCFEEARLPPRSMLGPLKQLWIGGDPFPKTADTALLANGGAPSHDSLSLADVAHVARLIPRPPAIEPNWNLLAIKRSKGPGEFVPDRERIAGSSANVEYLPRRDIDLCDCGAKRANQVIDEEEIPDLFPVPVDREGPTGLSRNDKMSDPTLVFIAKLPR